MFDAKTWSKQYYKKNKEHINKRNREYIFYHRYGITYEQVQQIIKSQRNRCLICHTLFDKTYMFSPVVDHDHETENVRGILCRNCNSMIGYAKDKTDLLQSGINYLQRSIEDQIDHESFPLIEKKQSEN